ncbi:alpha/beta hydrolase [Flexivirga sp. ID2601S]|uniref:Alpha/beta hydrolase n=1 Tax=Flexivirga aerilata TaxID=1656889 RepID=A0A849AGD1_9MICO|nr:alpha/beta hydrolase [Flexivirga aerilata]NNG38268.1 alpha/beta hydrolase [Flexivirga aerilata]
MTLDAAVQAHLDAERAVDWSALSPAAARAELRAQIDRNFRRFATPREALPLESEIALRHAGRVVRVRLFRPRTGTLPVSMLLHGGGWTSGSIDELVTVAEARHRAAGADVVVATVDYALAPEHPFPAALEDVRVVVDHLIERARDLDLDISNFSIGGSSAGANLAAATVLSLPTTFTGLLLEVPALDLTGATMRVGLSTDPQLPDIDVDALIETVLAYVGDLSRTTLPSVSPLLASQVSTFPSTVIHTAALDPLKYDGAAFAERLTAAGVPVTLRTYDGALHGSAILTKSWPTAARWQADLVASLRAIHRVRGSAAASGGTMRG